MKGSGQNNALISKGKWYNRVGEIIGYIILFPLLIPVMIFGGICGIALYIVDKRNKGLGN